MPYITDIEELSLERGMERGLERGLERGVERGVDEILLALLERVCGPLGKRRRRQVEDLPLDQAKALALDLLEFRSVADLDAWLAARRS